MALTGDILDKNKTPFSPLGLQATDISSRSISLKWDLNPGSHDTLLYHIFYRVEDSTRFLYIFLIEIL